MEEMKIFMSDIKLSPIALARSWDGTTGGIKYTYAQTLALTR